MDPMADPKKIRVAVNGYGVIGKRVAAAVALQEDMSLAGVSDVVTDWRARMATRNGFRLFGATGDHASGMRARHRDGVHVTAPGRFPRTCDARSRHSPGHQRKEMRATR